MLKVSIPIGSSTVDHSEVNNSDGWDEIHGFQSPGEFARFERWISEALDEGALTEIPVETQHEYPTFRERWFRDRSGMRWRLVMPDPPFRGEFERIDRGVPRT